MFQYHTTRIDPPTDTAITVRIDTWLSIRHTANTLSLLFNKKAVWGHRLDGFMANKQGVVRSVRVRKWSAEAGRKKLYIHRLWKFSNCDCWSQWHMKYERQQHSQLFIALQERKKKDGESSSTIYTPGQSWYYFFFRWWRWKFTTPSSSWARHGKSRDLEKYTPRPHLGVFGLSVQ